MHGFKNLILLNGNNSQIIWKIQCTPIKFPTAFFAEMNRLILKFIWNCQETSAKVTLKSKNKVEGFTLPCFTTSYKARVIKTVWQWRKNNKQTCISIHFILIKGPSPFNRERIVFSFFVFNYSGPSISFYISFRDS